MVDVILDPFFRKSFAKIKDASMKEKIIKQISKIKDNPEIGKPIRFERKGTRELYIKPFRISYMFSNGEITLLYIYHKDLQ